jgi:hypothetical protein
MNKSEKLESLNSLSNENLLELYSDYVRLFHYNPHTTSSTMKELLDLKIKLEDLESLVLDRMIEKPI